MKETLASLWNGQFSVCREVTNNKEAEELNRLIQKHYQDLRGRLDEKGLAALEKLEECQNDLLMIECESSFVRGFCTSTKIMTEALAKE